MRRANAQAFSGKGCSEQKRTCGFLEQLACFLQARVFDGLARNAFAAQHCAVVVQDARLDRVRVRSLVFLKNWLTFAHAWEGPVCFGVLVSGHNKHTNTKIKTQVHGIQSCDESNDKYLLVLDPWIFTLLRWTKRIIVAKVDGNDLALALFCAAPVGCARVLTKREANLQEAQRRVVAEHQVLDRLEVGHRVERVQDGVPLCINAVGRVRDLLGCSAVRV